MDRNKARSALFSVVRSDVRNPEWPGLDSQRVDVVPLGRVPGQPGIVPLDVEPRVGRQNLWERFDKWWKQPKAATPGWSTQHRGSTGAYHPIALGSNPKIIDQWDSIRCKLNGRWQHQSLIKDILFSSWQLFLSLEKRSRLSSGTSSAIYSWWSLIDSLWAELWVGFSLKRVKIADQKTSVCSQRLKKNLGLFQLKFGSEQLRIFLGDFITNRYVWFALNGPWARQVVFTDWWNRLIHRKL